MLRWLRRAARQTAPARPACPLRLDPVHDITVQDGTLHSTGSDPYVLLHPPDGHGFPAGRCEFVFIAGRGTVPLQPVLYLDTGAGFNEAQTIRLPGGAAGTHRQRLDLPAGLLRLRFDPTGLAGPLPIGGAALLPRDGPALPPARDYAAWVDAYDVLQPDDLREIAAHIAALRVRPTIHVRMEGGDAAARALTEASLSAQLYPHWQPAAPSDPPHAPLLLLQAGDVLAPHALYRLATAPSAPVTLTDEDRLDPATGARSVPVFRSLPSAITLAGGMPPGAVLLRGAAAASGRALAGTSPVAIRTVVLEYAAGAVHVPGVLVHRTGAVATAYPAPAPALPSPAPTVSIVIASRDAVALLRRTLEGVLHRTAYPAIEVVVMDNGSTDPAAHAYYAELAGEARVRVIPAPGPFNYAALNNAGVAAATGEIVVLLNNDMDVTGPDWLSALVAWAVQPGIGAAGAKLLYGDGTIQHAGIVTGLHGLAGHPYRHMPADADIHGGALGRVREVSAVTGACLAIRRDLYDEIGGLDAESFAVSYNDVDLCLRLRAAGHRIVWTPDATLLHLESASRGLDARPDNAARAQAEHDALLRRWGAALLADPFYNAQLDLGDEACGLAWPPRTPQPWREGFGLG